MRRATDCPSQSGFTLVEMIVSIVVGAILVAMVGMFGRWQIQSYFDLATRAELTDAADTALRRITRDLQKALPNSVRVVTDATGVSFLEFVPIADAGRYRADFGSNGAGNKLDFQDATRSVFDILGPTIAIAAGQQLVVYNLGISSPDGITGSDVYEGLNRRAIPAGGLGAALTTVTFTPTARPLPLASPANRFHIVDGPVTYECNPNTRQIVRRWCYAFQAAQPTANFAALGVHGGCAAVQAAVLASDVDACTVSYDGFAALQRNAILTIDLSLRANDETVRLMHQVEVMNTP